MKKEKTILELSENLLYQIYSGKFGTKHRIELIAKMEDIKKMAIDYSEMTLRCGDANPNGNISFNFKGGCGQTLKIKDAYRCTGCGGFFHLDCIFKHFEQEEGHDYARRALAKIRTYITCKLVPCLKPKDRKLDPAELLIMVQEGLDRKPEAKRLKI